MANYNTSDNPEYINEYLVHLRVVKMLSERTIQEYYFDIRLFLKYIRAVQTDTDLNIEDMKISDVTPDDLKKISVTDIYNFIFYTSDERHNKDRARYRKISALRSFFKYLTKVAHLIDADPMRDIEVPSPKSSMPRFLSLNESMRLLNASNNSESVRNYCIITLFLNCGMRLSELVGINVSDVDFFENRMRVLGKGRKERMVYLNNACIESINNYLAVRNENHKADSEPALFISNRGTRISKRRVQQIVEETLKLAGLDGKGLSTHKLRHTAATLMYQYGDADVLTLKELLGHSSTATTEIYTHLNDERVRNAVENNPLANINKQNKE